MFELRAGENRSIRGRSPGLGVEQVLMYDGPVPTDYRSTLDHLLEGFQVLDADLRYRYVNPAAAAHGRTTPAALEGRLMTEAYPGIEASPTYELLLRCLRDQVPANVENHFTFPDGSARWYELRIEPIPDGLVVHSVDIDDRKAAEAALRALNESLEAQVEERTRELLAAYAELEAFSYSVSHDLRAPLRAIDGFGRMLEEDCGASLDGCGTEYVKRIRGATSRMGSLIDDLLELSRVVRAPMETRSVDLSALVRDALSDLAARDPHRRVDVHVEDEIVAVGDPGLLRVVIDNLVGNAWKFTSKKSGATIRFGRGTLDEQPAYVFEDDGVGFDSAQADRLFRPFTRLHRAEEFPGTGVGLATVHRIVRRHGGEVRAEGRVGEGARVTFRLGSAAPTSASP